MTTPLSEEAYDKFAHPAASRASLALLLTSTILPHSPSPARYTRSRDKAGRLFRSLSTSRGMLVFHTPLSLLHNPPHEILSGCVQPYFESPERYFRILTTLLKSTAFEGRTLEWPVEEVVTEEVLEAIRPVHDERYLAFLAEIYDEWIAEGGSKDAALPETFLRSDLLLEEGGVGSQKDGAIARIGPSGCLSNEQRVLMLSGTGRHSFDLSAPVTASPSTPPSL